jgi:hypothetical protein
MSVMVRNDDRITDQREKRSQDGRKDLLVWPKILTGSDLTDLGQENGDRE